MILARRIIQAICAAFCLERGRRTGSSPGSSPEPERHLPDVPCRRGRQGRRRQVDRRRRREVRGVGARRAQAQMHRLPRGRLRREAAASGEAEAGQLRDLPREGGQGVRRDGARHGAQGRQRRRRDLHRLPRHARHPAREGSGVADQSRQPRGDLLASATAATRSSRKGKLPGGNVGEQVPRQHPRQGAQGRGAGVGADVHELPRRAQHPRQGRSGEPHESRRGFPTPAAAATSPSARRTSRACTASCGRTACSPRPAAPTATPRTRSSSTTRRRSRPR